MNETKTLYFDCSGGLTADLIVGALCDLGVAPSALEWELGQVDLGGYHLHFDRSAQADRPGVAFWFHAGEHHHDERDHGHGKAGHDHGHGHDDHGHSHDAHGHDHPDEHGHDHHHGHGCGHDHGDGHGCDGHDHTPAESNDFKVGDARERIESSELGEATKGRASSILQRLAGVADEISKAQVAALICACAGIEHLRVGRVAFFARRAEAAQEDALGAAIAADFVTSTCAMPAVKEEKAGRGLDREGRVIRAVLGTED